MAEISVSIQRTINLGNFENVRVEAGAKVTDDPTGQNYDELYKSVNYALEKIIETKLEELSSKKTAPPVSERKAPNPAGSRFRVPTVPE